MDELTALGPENCRRLLGAAGRGRVVYTEDALPAVAPTRYVVWGGRLWFPVLPGSALLRHADGAVLAYHVDQVDPAHRSGWSVTVLGECRYVPFPARPDTARNLTADADDGVLALDMQHFTGRRLGSAPPPATERLVPSA